MIKLTNIAALLILIIMVLNAPKASAQHTILASEVEFENGVISKYLGTNTNIIIPDNFNGNPVIGIGPYSFTKKNIEKVIVAAGIKYIGNSSFSNNPLTHLQLNEGLIKLGYTCFANCYIDTLTLPQSLEIIGNSAFYGNNILELNFKQPSNIKYFGEKAFFYANCDIIFPVNSNKGFKYYIDKASTVFAAGDTLNRYDNYWSELPNHVVEANEVTFIDGEIVTYKGSYTNITIPVMLGNDSVLYIGQSAFEDAYLHTLNLSEGLQQIGDLAFARNYLAFVDLPASIKTINNFAFTSNRLNTIKAAYASIDFGHGVFNCNEIEKVNNRISNGLFYKNSNSKTDSTTIISYGGKSKRADFIPATVKKIDESAFYNIFSFLSYKNIDYLILPDSIDEIGKAAFMGNDIDSLALPNSVVKLGSQAFSNNRKLAYVSFGDSSCLNYFEVGVFSQTMIDTLYLPTPVLPVGYYGEFLGWYQYQDTLPTEMPLLLSTYYAQAFYAKFNTIPYQIEYRNVGSRNDTLNPIIYTIEDHISSLQPPYDSTGVKFAGWYTDALYNDSVNSDLIPLGSMGDTIFYAKWIERTLKINSAENEVFNIYPNPATDKLTISHQGVPYSLIIYSSTGVKLMENTIHDSNNSINLNNWQRGIYFISLVSESGIQTHKVIKM